MTVADFIGWLIIGLIAGWLASMVMGRGGYGVVGDIVVGVVGAFIGGFQKVRKTGRGDSQNSWGLRFAGIMPEGRAGLWI